MDILERIPFNSNQAVVFDIDDTLISSNTYKPIPSILNLYNYCFTKGYHLYIITARPNTRRTIIHTLWQLKLHGITGFKIQFRPQFNLDVATYKLNARKSIPQTVIMSVGDQRWDIGEFGGVGILVKQ